MYVAQQTQRSGAFAKDLKGDCKVNMLSVPLNTVPAGKMETTQTVCSNSTVTAM